jgi:hypothetical protein
MAFEYLADSGIDCDVVMSERAARITAELMEADASLVAAGIGSIPLTKYQFRQLFTFDERVLIDDFNANYQTSNLLTDEQKDQLRTRLTDFDVTTEIHLTNPDVIAAVNMYEAIGLIAAGRSVEILNG